jgi:hypothetical protein
LGIDSGVFQESRRRQAEKEEQERKEKEEEERKRAFYKELLERQLANKLGLGKQ